jgi:GH24 family phage-related lysozyme (muramidase)
MTGAFLNKLLPLLEGHEGRSRFMYPDSKRNVTVALGHLLSNVQSALLLPFYVVETRTPATKSQIAAGWAFVRAHNKPYPALEMDDAAIDALAETDLTGFEPTMQHTFGSADLPEPAELALWDMVFNLGSFHEFPELVAAVHAGDWNRAADECVRRDVSATRNTDTQALFREALMIGQNARQIA